MPYDIPPAPALQPPLSAIPQFGFEIAQFLGDSVLANRTFLGGKIIIGDVETISCNGDRVKCEGQPLYWVKAEILDPRLFSDWNVFGSEFYERNGIEVSRYLLQAIAVELGVKARDIRLDLYLDCQSIILQEREVRFDYCREGSHRLAESLGRSLPQIGARRLVKPQL